MSKGWTRLGGVISPWDVLCWEKSVLSHHFKVLLILFADSLDPFLGKGGNLWSAFWNIFQADSKKLSSDACVQDGGTQSKLSQGRLCTVSSAKGPLISPAMGVGLLHVTSTLPDKASEECLGWNDHELPGRVGCLLTAGLQNCLHTASPC